VQSSQCLARFAAHTLIGLMLTLRGYILQMEVLELIFDRIDVSGPPVPATIFVPQDAICLRLISALILFLLTYMMQQA
jgi:hypothetical protein